MVNENCRMYVLAHRFLSSVQKGVQGGHAIAEMSVKYHSEDCRHKLYTTWAKRDKTLILLDGGNTSSLRAFRDMLLDKKTVAWADFHEDEDSLDGALTAVAVILSESQRNMLDKLSPWYSIAEAISALPLAV